MKKAKLGKLEISSFVTAVNIIEKKTVNGGAMTFPTTIMSTPKPEPIAPKPPVDINPISTNYFWYCLTNATW